MVVALVINHYNNIIFCLFTSLVLWYLICCEKSSDDCKWTLEYVDFNEVVLTCLMDILSSIYSCRNDLKRVSVVSALHWLFTPITSSQNSSENVWNNMLRVLCVFNTLLLSFLLLIFLSFFFFKLMFRILTHLLSNATVGVQMAIALYTTIFLMNFSYFEWNIYLETSYFINQWENESMLERTRRWRAVAAAAATTAMATAMEWEKYGYILSVNIWWFFLLIWSGLLRAWMEYCLSDIHNVGE